MEYTHLTRIGNEGDLVKHAVLARLVDDLLTDNPTDDFFCVETHPGRAEYRLPEKGRWEYGIGKFSQTFYAQVSKPKHNQNSSGSLQTADQSSRYFRRWMSEKKVWQLKTIIVSKSIHLLPSFS